MSQNSILNGLSVSLRDSRIALPLATAVGLLFVSGVVWPAIFPPQKKAESDVDELGGWSLLTVWPFFEQRHDFLQKNFKKTGADLFRFKLLQHSVTAIRGNEARKTFFDNQGLSLVEGYRILTGGAPRLSDIDVDVATELSADVSLFNKRLLKLLNRDRLDEVLPSLYEDVHARTETWGHEGTMDPFNNIYDIVFQTTVRMASCRELASDIDAVTRLQGYFRTCQKSATPTAMLLPWFPGQAKREKEEATKNLFAMLWGYVENRRNAEEPNNDAVDVLIRQDGLSNEDIISFIIDALVAGAVNTGLNSCWMLLFLAFHSKWKEAVIQEVQTLINTHTNTTLADPLHKRLSQIPVSVWEEEMPVMDAVIRETVRIVVNFTALRRNAGGGDIDIVKGKTLPKGHFLAYSIADSHLNPEFYTSPEEFDPGRFAPGREEDKRGPYAYVGWGGGRHPCTGMKIAKLELKMIVALFVAAYEFDIVDKSGSRRATALPVPDIQQQRPVGEPCFIKFRRIVE